MTRLRITTNGGLPLAARSLGTSEAQALVLAHGTRQTVYVKCDADPGYVLTVGPLFMQHTMYGEPLTTQAQHDSWVPEWACGLVTAVNRSRDHHHHEGSTP